jgi:hypothetical protein
MTRPNGPPESWPLDTRFAVALIGRVKRDIDDTSEELSDLLLADLLCAAWPTSTAQDQ